MSHAPLTQHRLKEVLHYDPITGVFTWRLTLSNRAPARSRAGTTSNPYDKIGVDGGRYYAQRLAWLYMTGSWPVRHVDHADVAPRRNEWSNLRAADKSLNSANTHRRKDNTSGFKGVHWNKRTGVWVAKIVVRGRQIRLGSFSNAALAHASYTRAATRYFGPYGRAV